MDVEVSDKPTALVIGWFLFAGLFLFAPIIHGYFKKPGRWNRNKIAFSSTKIADRLWAAQDITQFYENPHKDRAYYKIHVRDEVRAWCETHSIAEPKLYAVIVRIPAKFKLVVRDDQRPYREYHKVTDVYYERHYELHFKKKEDMVMFKLKWMGE
jgi:hypothetical protein